MRTIIIADEGDTAKVRERREIFEVSELRLSYTCPDCKNEFIFNPDKSGEPKQSWPQCPMCGDSAATGQLVKNATGDVLLWEALSRYREFYKMANRLPLKMLVVTRAKSTES